VEISTRLFQLSREIEFPAHQIAANRLRAWLREMISTFLNNSIQAFTCKILPLFESAVIRNPTDRTDFKISWLQIQATIVLNPSDYISAKML
jgi:hypothetical protein